MTRNCFDILIAGGGPAGLAAAIAAAERGCRSVALVERKRIWGFPIQCAEMVPKFLGKIVPLEGDSIVQEVTGLRFHLDGRSIGFLRAPAYILDRSRFETALAQRAAALGVELLQPAIVQSVSLSRVMIRQGHEAIAVEPAILIGADGPRSLVRRSFFDESIECDLSKTAFAAPSSGSARAFRHEIPLSFARKTSRRYPAPMYRRPPGR